MKATQNGGRFEKTNSIVDAKKKKDNFKKKCKYFDHAHRKKVELLVGPGKA